MKQIPEIEAQIGASLQRIVADHNAPPAHRLKVYITGQTRNVIKAINATCTEEQPSSRSSTTPRTSTV